MCIIDCTKHVKTIIVVFFLWYSFSCTSRFMKYWTCFHEFLCLSPSIREWYKKFIETCSVLKKKNNECIKKSIRAKFPRLSPLCNQWCIWGRLLIDETKINIWSQYYTIFYYCAICMCLDISVYLCICSFAFVIKAWNSKTFRNPIYAEIYITKL